jgi:hypothetical protein
MIAAEHERPQTGPGETFGDAVTFAFADPESGICASARLGFSAASGTRSALAVLSSDREPVAAVARGGIEAPEPDWSDVEAAGVRARIDEPLRRWTAQLAGGEASFEASFEALGEPLEFTSDSAIARAGGQQGYEQLCRVEADVTIGGRVQHIECLGSREHAWGAPDWDRLDRAATVSAWLAPDRAVALRTVRPDGLDGHEEESVTAVLLEEDNETGPVARPVAEPRLSTTFDEQGRQRRAGLELWVDEEDQLPRRVGGEVLCGTTLELGRLRVEASFFSWRMEGRAGAGRYELVHRAQ